MFRVSTQFFCVLMTLAACGSDCPEGTYPVGDGACALLETDDGTPAEETEDNPTPGVEVETPEEPPVSTMGSIVVWNETGSYAVTQLDVQPCGSVELGDWDYLGNDYLYTGQSFTVFDLDFGCYDIFAYDGNARVYWDTYGVRLDTDNPTYTYTLR